MVFSRVTSALIATLFISLLAAQTPAVAPPAQSVPAATSATREVSPAKDPAKETSKEAGDIPGVKKDDDKSADLAQEGMIVEKIRREYRFEDDGLTASSVTARIKVQTQAGVQEMGQLVFGFNSANQKLEIDYLKVIKPSGEVVAAKASDFQDVPSQIQKEAPSYTDYRERHVTVSSLRAGDTLEYKITTKDFEPLIPRHFWFEHVFNKQAITLSEELVLDLPASRVIKLKTKPDFKPATAEKAGRKVYTWSRSYTKRETKEELKKLARKQAREDFYPDIQLTTFKSWEELGDWYAGLQRSQLSSDAAVQAKAAELTKDKTTDEEKLRAIYDFVAQGYRYVSLSFGVGRYQPHAASEVLRNEYGDCKDKHTLLSALLKASGYTVQPVLIGSQRKLDPEVPSPSQFDHVFSAILPKAATASSQPIAWVDTTTEIAPFGLLSSQLRKKQALMVGLVGPSKLVETPANAPFQPLFEVEVKGAISELGKIKGTMKMTMRGDEELGFRTIFRNVPEAKWKNVGEYLSNASGIGGEVENVKLTNLLNTREPLVIEFNFSRPNFLLWTNKRSELNVPFPPATFNDAFTSPDDDEDTDTAKVEPAPKGDPKPIMLGGPLVTNFKLTLTLPATHKSRTPVPTTFKRDYAEYTSSYKVEGQTLTAARSLSMKERELPQARRSDYAAFARAVRTDERQKFFVESLGNPGSPEVSKEIKTEELMDSARDAMASQNYKMALTLLKMVAEKEPKNKQVWNALGDAYMYNRQFTEAEQAFRKQIANDSFDQFAYANLARSLWLQRRHTDAIAALKQQLEINPLDANSFFMLSELYMIEKKYAEAAEVSEKAVSLNPDNPSTHVNLGRAYLHLKKAKEATESFDKAVELAPDPGLWNNIAYEMAEADTNLDKAQQYAESAVQSVTSSLRNVAVERVTLRDMGTVAALGSYWDTLGWVAFKKGDIDKAERYIAASWQLTQSGEVGDHLAQIYEKRGKKEEAKKLYAQALNAERHEDDTMERLTRLMGDKKKAQSMIDSHKSDLKELRTIKVGKLPAQGSADFFVMLANGGKVESVRFISGAESLKLQANALKALNYGEVFPDNNPTRVVRRGTLSCDPASQCIFVMLKPEEITAVD